jgi:hypothetical protein
MVGRSRAIVVVMVRLSGVSLRTRSVEDRISEVERS